MAVNLIDSQDIKINQTDNDITLETDKTTLNNIIDTKISGTKKVVWTNLTPTTTFNEQDITIEDISDYDYYEIIYKIWTGSNYQHSTGLIQTGAGAFLSGIEITPSSNVGAYQSRKVDYTSTTQLHFNDCFVENVYTNASTTINTSNNIMIPMVIIAYKI